MIAAVEEVRSAASGQLALWGDYSLADPFFLLLIPVAVLLFLHGRSRRGRAHGLVPVLPGARIVRSWRQRLMPVTGVLHLLALCLAIAALARPLRSNVEREIVSAGVDIALVIDRSGSMRFEDLERGKSRLDVVKEVVADFAERRMTDERGAADNVGLITFAHYPQMLCPFTLDVDALRGFLDGVELVRRREEDGTAIGVALAKAVALLRESDAKSKVVVLLTDGENNVPDIPPLSAGELAAEEGVRVYTIYAARNLFKFDAVRGAYVATADQHDTTELRHIAELTGGRFYQARDRDGLEGIYAEIEVLERTERRERRHEETFDLYPRLLLGALVLYGTAWFSFATWARRVA